MSNINDFKNKDTKFTGTTGLRISTGATGTRVDEQARLRFNTTTNLMEYYSGTEWKSIDAPPTITSFTVNGGANVTSASLLKESGTITVAISGSLFDTTGATVLFVGNGGGDVSPLTTVRNSTSLITITLNGDSFSNTFEPYDLKITNGSGLFALLENCILSDARPVFTTAAGTLGTILNGARSSYTLSPVTATDADGDTITYSVSVGALPTGLSLNSATGAITGTASEVVSNTTSTFTIAAATATVTSTRQFSITVNAPVIQSYTSTGAFTFAVPSGLTAVDVLVVAGGGGNSQSNGSGGGGAGGLIYRPGFTVTPGGTVSGTVGGGGAGATDGSPGDNSTFGTLTAIGGGSAGRETGSRPGRAGGSGGGGVRGGSSGPGTQPGQPGDSGTYGFGNPGGANVSDGSPHYSGGGGGGAGAAGTNGGNFTPGGTGGAGRSYSISGSSVGYAGGGGGGPYNNGSGVGSPNGQGATTFGGGDGGGNFPGTANRGGGAGGGTGVLGGTNPSGGSGVVIIQY